jgi:phytoene dehydrogenase-like protein
MVRKIAIIGGGISGLSAGCYGRMNGYDTEIFEMHTIPGGVCTGWVRKGYTFDGCLHWLTGSSLDSTLYRMWEELGALTGKKIINHEAFGHLVTTSGKRIVQYAELGRFVEELKRIAPEDTAALDQLREDVKLFGAISGKIPLAAPTKTGLIRKLRGLIKMSRYMPVMQRYFSLSIEKYTASLKSQELREALSLIAPLVDFPMFYLINIFAMLDKGHGGWPEGGSLGLAHSIEKRYRELGGTIRYGAKVEEIIVEKDRAVGVRLTDSSAHRADLVIGAADGRSTIYGMLKGRYVNAKIDNDYKTLPLYNPLTQVSFGVNRDMREEPRLTTFGFSAPRRFGGQSVSWLWLNNYAFDATMAPPGKSTVTVVFWDSYDYWEKLSLDRKRYREEKERVQQDVTAWLESIYPGIGADIEAVDVATPMTTVRYTGNWRASYEGWRPTPSTLRKEVDKTLPGLKGFQMIGQWTAAFAGLPTAAKDGREAVEMLCREEGKPFVTTIGLGG